MAITKFTLNVPSIRYKRTIQLQVNNTRNYRVIKKTGYIEKDFSIPPQMDRYMINGRQSSFQTIQKLLREEKFDSKPIEIGIQKITFDYGKYGENFPNHYYETFGEALFYLVLFCNMPKGGIPKIILYYFALEESCSLIDNEANFLNGLGAPLFHIYENVVRKDDDTGLDKLKHFLFSAYYTYKFNSKVSDFLGRMKEFFKDEVVSWFNSEDIGWDDKDIEANQKGIAFGKKLTEKVSNENN